MEMGQVVVLLNISLVQFYWAGKGTTRIPVSGVYGPVMSAFSIVSSELYDGSACVL